MVWPPRCGDPAPPVRDGNLTMGSLPAATMRRGGQNGVIDQAIRISRIQFRMLSLGDLGVLAVESSGSWRSQNPCSHRYVCYG
jgi:hypothetical protein